MMKKILAGVLVVATPVWADVHTVITSQGTQVYVQQGTTTQVLGGYSSSQPVVVTPGQGTATTTITNHGTYMAIPLGTGTTVIQVSGARK